MMKDVPSNFSDWRDCLESRRISRSDREEICRCPGVSFLEKRYDVSSECSPASSSGGERRANEVLIVAFSDP